MKRIYVAGPLGAPDEGRRARLDAALAAGAALVQAGLAPFVPHLWAAAMHADGLAPYEQWMAYDFAWLDVCDAVLRIPGHSPGADREVTQAQAAGLPVFYKVEDVVAWARRREPNRAGQAAYRERQRAAGLCSHCSEPRHKWGLCQRHYDAEIARRAG